MNLVKTHAPAKLNLTLEVGQKREDGYHPLTSVMTHIALYDEVSARRIKGGEIQFHTNAVYLKNDDNNLCVFVGLCQSAVNRFPHIIGTVIHRDDD